MQRPHAGWNTIHPQDKNHKLWMDKAAAVSAAKSDEKRVPGKKPVVEKEGKKAAGTRKQERPFVGKNGK